ncbi:family 20 glycosylhydrolase [Gulosibacter sp. 10]|uniref:family 20 glycosylhydrolase n=1 Tax=Gulosibacter sp. 10 TaxID=1255570 RepID=UPI00097F055F|nr:family 20 glycosylhydrolase [Gulosibacter sp. 10]SJM59199.1 Beta-hexosaminidase [Gulosibacter sp. 10]
MSIRRMHAAATALLLALGAAAGGMPAPPSAAAAPAASAELVDPIMVPPPAEFQPNGSSWSPSEGTRILVTDESLAGEGARLAEELVALGLLDHAPEVAFIDPGEAETLAADLREGHEDLILTTADAPGIRVATADVTSVVVAGADAAEVFRVTRPLLQQLQAAGMLPGGSYRFELPAGQIRSLHIDIARKHYSLESLEALIRQLSWFGFTELELHFSENEGFAIESTSHPDIVSPDAHSQEEIRGLVELANSLHIRVVPSLDMPGHLDHALDAYPELRLRDASGGEVFGALDVTRPEGVEFAHELIAEYAELFAQPGFEEPVPWNLGADEFVDFGDAGQVAALAEAARAEFGPDATAYDALTGFVNDTAAVIRDEGFAPRVWSDGMLRAEQATLDEEVEIAYWTQRPPGAVPATEFAERGYRLLNVNDEYLYFVLGERVEYYYPTGDAILADWHEGVYPSVDGAPELVEDSAGGMLAVWSDIPDAMGDAEVVDAVRGPIAAMAVKFADPDSAMTFADLETALAGIGHAPEVEAPAAPDPLPTVSADGGGAEAPDADERTPSAPTMPLLVLGGAALLIVLGLGAVMLRRRSRR